VFDALIRRAANGDRAAEATVEKKAPPRPTIALALGGGIARGFAHIGVLHALAKHGFEPDIVVGTSVGSVVGACYAFGRLDELEQWALGLTTRGVLGYLDVSLGGSGLIGGDRLAARLDQTFGDARIEDMPKRYACIATELGTGHEIWLTRGRIVDAVRASYALPGIFRPVHLGGRWLVDGALVNPVPVSAARALGARLVIAVNLNSEIFGRGGTISSHGTDEEDARTLNEMRARPEGLRSMLSPEFLLKRHLVGGKRSPNIMNIMIDSFNVMQDRITRSRLAGDPSDVTISPRMGKIGLFDFHRAKEAIAIGESAAERAIPEVTEAIAALT
jgi:NTE family protein